MHTTSGGTEEHTATLRETFDVRDPSRTTLVQNEPVVTGTQEIREKSLFRSGVHADSPPSITL